MASERLSAKTMHCHYHINSNALSYHWNRGRQPKMWSDKVEDFMTQETNITQTAELLAREIWYNLIISIQHTGDGRQERTRKPLT